MKRPPWHAYLSPGPFAPGMHGLADAPEADPPGWWETQWDNAVQQFKTIWAAFTNSKTTLALTGNALDSIDPADVDAGKLSDLRTRQTALSIEESSIDDDVALGVAKIQEVENRLGWPPTNLGIFGVDDAIVITTVVTAGIAAVGYYVYRITTHTQDVNELASELQAIGKGVVSPAQLIQLKQAQAASTPGGGVVAQILSQVLPYVGVGIAGYLLFKAFMGRRS